MVDRWRVEKTKKRDFGGAAAESFKKWERQPRREVEGLEANETRASGNEARHGTGRPVSEAAWLR
jgi:hypothetical protein